MRTFIPASFHRGGTSKAIIFKKDDLPSDEDLWDNIFLHVMGSPDAYGRQLNGLGGGLSSLSKVVVVAPSEHSDIDLDYSFYQISVDQNVVDAGAMCGNMATSVGPFSIEQGLVENPGDGPVALCIRNTNTDKIYEAEFSVADGQVVESGDFSIPGVSGTGARIGLRFIDPAGSRTDALLPTGNACDQLTLPGGDPIEASLVDATNPVIFVRAGDLGLQGTETPEAIESNNELMQQLENIRRAGSVAMGLSASEESTILANPKIAVVAPPLKFKAINGETFEPDDMDVTIRIVSMNKVHRAVTLTGGMCLAAAANLPGFVIQPVTPANDSVRIAHPSGVFPVSVTGRYGKTPEIKSLTCYRTQRCLMAGRLPVPNRLLDSGLQADL